MRNRRKDLTLKYPPSPPCACDICVSYCKRPGWWTLKEAERAVDSGFASRMMLEMAPDRSFGVLAPAFKGSEGFFALQETASQGCNFLKNNLCELHGTGYQPLECRVCHHEQPGRGPMCHADIELEWNTPAGKALVERWGKITGIQERLNKLG
jgi:hypothetical protein